MQVGWVRGKKHAYVFPLFASLRGIVLPRQARDKRQETLGTEGGVLCTYLVAFLSFRDSLDTADTTRFPVAQFGPVDDPGAVRKNAFLAMPVIL